LGDRLAPWLTFNRIGKTSAATPYPSLATFGVNRPPRLRYTDGEDDGGGQDQGGDEAMGDGKRQHRRLAAGDPDRREAGEIRADAEHELNAQ